ncbi:hypothetical protein TrST_g7152 [Triparma strigata]|uniref:Uncharacterized protein n=1 Tax=Triparma strigata TaxID=1606541 RepID=A0A9W7ELK4_9STRA|nr:hypothetical protein TrST_g7152 [Triparma strigata]
MIVDEEEPCSELPPGVVFYAAPAKPEPVPQVIRPEEVREQDNARPNGAATVGQASRTVGDSRLKKVASGSAVTAVRTMRRKSSTAKKAAGGRRKATTISEGGSAKEVVSTPCATGHAKQGPICYNYLLCPGNNSRVILAVMRRRPWFGCVGKNEKLGSPAVNVVWEMWRSLARCAATPHNAYCALNHLDGNRQLVSKKNLWKNLARHCSKTGEGDLNDFVPPTFLLKGRGASGAGEGDPERVRFKAYLDTASSTTENCYGLEMPDHKALELSGLTNEEEEEGDGDGDSEGGEGDGDETSNVGEDGDTEETEVEGESGGGKEAKDGVKAKNKGSKSDCETGSLWIVKPAASTNRGCGIQVCQGFDQVIQAVTNLSKSKLNNKLTKKHGWVVQKYLERPYLVHGRKFDLRVYVLFTVNPNKKAESPVNTYMYDEFYVRTSGVAYNVSKKNLKNSMMHLTNDAIQKKVKDNYGKHEDANKLSMKQFGEYLTEHSGVPEDYIETVMRPKIQEIVKLASKATRHKLNTNGRKHGFELMGWDFMIDTDLKPCLLEVNSNPCLEQPCLLLERLVSEVVESSFQLGVDKFFPPPKVITKKGEVAKQEIAMLREVNQFQLLE